MNSKEIKWTIDRLDDGDWQRMKEHMDKKFPNMKVPDMQSFKELVRLYGLATERYEKQQNVMKRNSIKFTTVSIQEIRAQPTLRLDPGYWIKKKAQATSNKPQATSLPQSGDTVVTKKGKIWTTKH